MAVTVALRRVQSTKIDSVDTAVRDKVTLAR